MKMTTSLQQWHGGEKLLSSGKPADGSFVKRKRKTT